MSQSNTEPVSPGSMYGVKTYDLATAREYPGELEQLPNARIISTGNVPDECYIRLGSSEAPKLDLREFETITLPRGKSFGQVYIQNPAGAGTLELIVGIEVEPEREIVVDTIESITGTVDVDVVAQALDRLESELELEDAAASGTFANVHRRGDAMQVSVEDETTDLLRTTDQPLDVSGATVTVDDGGAFTIDAANQGTLPVEQQTPVQVENGAGTTKDVLGTGDEPLDVSGATVTTDLSNDITRSAGTVRQEQPGSLIAFQHTTSSTNAEALAANSVSPRGTVTVQADPDNAGDVFLGNGTNQPIQLSPGDSIGNINVDDTSDLSVNADNSGDAVNVVAS